MFELVMLLLGVVIGVIVTRKWFPRHTEVIGDAMIDDDTAPDYYAIMNKVMEVAAWSYKMCGMGLNIKWLSFYNEDEREEIYAVAYTKENRFGKIREIDHFTWQLLKGELSVEQPVVTKINKIEAAVRKLDANSIPDWAQ